MLVISFQQLAQKNPIAAAAMIEDGADPPDCTILEHEDSSFSFHGPDGDVYEWDDSDATWYNMTGD